ncbi:MAG: hypothetical protein RL885_13220 [Planctomycetota bacterium]
MRIGRSALFGLLVSLLSACGDQEQPRDVPVGEIIGAPLDAAPDPVPSKPATSAPSDPKPDADGLWPIDWAKFIGFDYPIPRHPDLGPEATAEREKHIPDEILAWNGRRVAVDGYMLPIDVDGEEVILFNLFHSLESCCFGSLAKITNWIEVQMPSGKGVEYYPYGQVRVTGRLSIGEYHVQGGVVAIYRIEGESAEPKW